MVAIASEDIAAIEPHALLGDAIVVEQADDARHLDFKVDALNPILMGLFELGLEVAHLAPGVEIVVSPLAVFDVNYFGQLPQEENERPANIHDVDRDVLPVEQQNAGIQGWA